MRRSLNQMLAAVTFSVRRSRCVHLLLDGEAISRFGSHALPHAISGGCEWPCENSFAPERASNACK